MPVSFNRDLRLPESEYFPGAQTKTGICVHHTVGGSARSTYNWWLNDKAMVGTAYIIAHDGTIHEVFDPAAWAWQFGLNWNREQKIKFERRFIGIEIASEGGLIEQDGNLYCFDRVSERTRKNRDEAFDYGQVYRGYRYYDKYESAQIDSLTELINHLCEEFTIPKVTPADHFKFFGESLKDFKGIIGHTMVRLDKSDPLPDSSLWQTIMSKCDVQAVDPGTGIAKEEKMNDADKDALFENNVQEINKMAVAAGSMVKGLLMELDRGDRDTYIRLHNAVSNGHSVKYDFVEGDPGLVFRVATALGFKNVTDDTLEVRNA